VTLVEVLIVVAIMAVISGGVTLVAFPLFKESQVKAAVQGCGVVRQAAQLEIQMGGATECPSMQDLIASKKIEAKRADDPWGNAYKVECEGDEIGVVSPGRDHKLGTPDDVRHDFKDVDVKRVAKL
jgi:general secretion pathway protein G